MNVNLERSRYNFSKENNWHDNLEIQICTEGSGAVLLDGKTFPFNKNDIVVVNSNVIHYTGTDSNLTYCCLILSNEFCRQVDIDPSVLIFEPFIKSPALADMLTQLREIYLTLDTPFRKARLNQTVLKILIELAEHHTVHKATTASSAKKYETVKAAISYIRDHYSQKITLDEIAKAVLCDKYALCREFKKLTGQTIVENLNNYRSVKAIDYLSDGYTVARTAALCGFDNLSFFTRTFKKYIGKLPSEYKK
ncbi:MAG: helix-turn-helix transcriptional regulator [Clostridia bacterium]|nr:helix-turn-helix transcriptional regulator [Clostridia bacterium]